MEQMTNYDSIMAIIDSNHYAVTKRKNGFYSIFSKDKRKIRATHAYLNLQAAKENIGETRNGTSENWINSLELAEIYPLPRELPNIKAGDMVVIMDNARKIEEFGELCKAHKEMVNNGEYEVKEVVSNDWGISYWIYTKDKSDYWRFPAHCVCKAYKKPQANQKEIDKAIALLKDNGKIVDGKVLIG